MAGPRGPWGSHGPRVSPVPHGSYASGAEFVSGLAPAVWVGGAAVAAAAAAALLLPRTRRATAVTPAAEPAEELEPAR